VVGERDRRPPSPGYASSLVLITNVRLSATQRDHENGVLAFAGSWRLGAPRNTNSPFRSPVGSGRRSVVRWRALIDVCVRCWRGPVGGGSGRWPDRLSRLRRAAGALRRPRPPGSLPWCATDPEAGSSRRSRIGRMRRCRERLPPGERPPSLEGQQREMARTLCPPQLLSVTMPAR
jgi:hypothetical protein